MQHSSSAYLRRLAKAADPAPWSFNWDSEQIECTAYEDETPIVCGPPPKAWKEGWPEQAEFIVAMRNSLRDILDENKRLRRALRGKEPHSETRRKEKNHSGRTVR